MLQKYQFTKTYDKLAIPDLHHKRWHLQRLHCTESYSYSRINHLNLPNPPHATPNLSGRNISDYLPSLVSRSNRKWLLRPRRRWYDWTPNSPPSGKYSEAPKVRFTDRRRERRRLSGISVPERAIEANGRRSPTLQGVNMAVAAAAGERAQNGRRRKRFFSPDDQEVFVAPAFPIGRRRRERSLLNHRWRVCGAVDETVQTRRLRRRQCVRTPYGSKDRSTAIITPVSDRRRRSPLASAPGE